MGIGVSGVTRRDRGPMHMVSSLHLLGHGGRVWENPLDQWTPSRIESHSLKPYNVCSLHL